MSAERQLILAVNAGSSSLKISLFKPGPTRNDPVALLLTASLANISSPPVRFSLSPAVEVTSAAATSNEELHGVSDHQSGFLYFLEYLQGKTSYEKVHIAHVCHRVVHGGDYSGPVVISNDTFHHIESLSDLAPLHNGAALTVVKTCLEAIPESISIAYFDTSFHSTIPPHISQYAIDPAIAKQKGLKKYGFHGLSYSYILRSVSRHLVKEPSNTTLVVMHLGSGASVCAIRAGHSLDTSMGLTPADGLPGATRSGSIDPSLIFHYTSDAAHISQDAAQDVHITAAEDILNRRAGWNALTGTTDFGAIAAQAARTPGEGSYALAFDMLVDRILNYVGAYVLKLGGARCVDALVFSGGIGERSTLLRRAVCAQCVCLGFEVDDRLNAGVDKVNGDVVEIGACGEGRTRVLVCRTDEQLEMARQCTLEQK